MSPTSFADAMKRSIKLEGPRIRLNYQTPEVYWTDIHEQQQPKMLGKWKWACKMPDKDGIGELGIPGTHPAITFNGKHYQIHVKMVDTTNGKVYWDAHYKLSPGF